MTSWQPMTMILIVYISSLAFCEGFSPESKAQLQSTIKQCLQLSPTDCSKGPHGPIGSWDVSAVTDMSSLFIVDDYLTPLAEAREFNGDISKWDVSRVTDMESMFSSESAFNGDISKWDVSKVTNMDYMFSSA